VGAERGGGGDHEARNEENSFAHRVEKKEKKKKKKGSTSHPIMIWIGWGGERTGKRRKQRLSKLAAPLSFREREKKGVSDACHGDASSSVGEKNQDR